MPKRKYPEQRSTTSAPQPGQGPATPSGNEVFHQQASRQEGLPEGEFNEEELAELDELRRSAAEAFDLISDATSELSEWVTEAYDAGRAFVRDNPVGAIVGAFAAGIVLGMLSSDD